MLRAKLYVGKLPAAHLPPPCLRAVIDLDDISRPLDFGSVGGKARAAELA